MGADQKRREARRLKFGSQQRGGQSTDASNIDEAHVGENLVGDRPTKRQKTQHGGKDRPQVSSNVPSKPEKDASEGTGETTLIAKGRGGNRGPVEEETTKSGQRFIVFIGNLPYSATTAAIKAHFAKVQPISIRHPTTKPDSDPKSNAGHHSTSNKGNRKGGKKPGETTGSGSQSKGYAFLEFDNYDRMKTCLKLYHHSLFSEHAHPHVHPDIGRDGDADADVDAGADEESTAKKQAGKGEVVEKGSRRLNVELTAGGGGAKSVYRKRKLREKNAKLNEQRRRQAETAKKAREKEGEGELGDGAGKSEKQEQEAPTVDDSSVHPSRRARVPV